MKIIPPTEYNIILENEEREIIERCVYLLDDIISVMTDNNCNTLIDSFDKINKAKIEQIMNDLDIIQNANKMC